MDACRDCQQVQAREILRVFGEMTNQNATFEEQILFFFAKQKEEALYRLITEVHPKCDLPHTKVSPGQQRAHLKSAYLNILGESFGMTGVNAARADRFLNEAKANIHSVTRDQLVKQLMSYCCPERLVRELLCDINNQSSDAERLISPKCKSHIMFCTATQSRVISNLFIKPHRYIRLGQEEHESGESSSRVL